MLVTFDLAARSAWIIATVLALTLCQTRAELSCIDDHGNAVDWYMAYKFPKLSGDRKFQTGHAYAYISSADTDERVGSPSEDVRKGVEDPESASFLRRFQDLLVKFGSPLVRPNRPNNRTSLARKVQQARSNESRWVASDKLIDDPDSLVMRTLAPAYDMKLTDAVSSVYYNDEPADADRRRRRRRKRSDDDDVSGSEEGDMDGVTTRSGSTNSRVAHAKGLVLMDEKSNSGIWLTHSVPKFPNPRNQRLDYPETATKFGQTLMCISFDLDKTGAKLINHLINMRPLVYDRKVSDSLLKQFPQLKNLDLYGTTRYRRGPKPALLTQSIETRAGQAMKIYSKPPSVQQDLYSGVLDHDLGADLYVETWRRGSGGTLNSTCPKSDYHINNVKDLRYSSTLQWDYLRDHSKWAITDAKEMATVCIADSNRMHSQFKRGSGAVCVRCPTCWTVFSNTIADTEPCPLGESRGSRSKTIDKGIADRIEKYLNATQH